VSVRVNFAATKQARFPQRKYLAYCHICLEVKVHREASSLSIWAESLVEYWDLVQANESSKTFFENRSFLASARPNRLRLAGLEFQPRSISLHTDCWSCPQRYDWIQILYVHHLPWLVVGESFPQACSKTEYLPEHGPIFMFIVKM
jgi:hypothetical protein